MTLRDEFGSVSEGAARRAMYGHRVAHGKAGQLYPLATAATVKPFARPKVEEPVKAKTRYVPKQYRRGVPDRVLAEKIKAAGILLIKTDWPNAQERAFLRQSAVYLIYDRARLFMFDIALMHGQSEHCSTSRDIRAVRKRLLGEHAKDEKARQRAIMRLV